MFNVQCSMFVWYAVSLLLFAFALLSKPMVVTLPFVLLLLVSWFGYLTPVILGQQESATVTIWNGNQLTLAGTNNNITFTDTAGNGAIIFPNPTTNSNPIVWNNAGGPGSMVIRSSRTLRSTPGTSNSACGTITAPHDVPPGGNDTITYTVSNGAGHDQVTTSYQVIQKSNPTP